MVAMLEFWPHWLSIFESVSSSIIHEDMHGILPDIGFAIEQRIG